MMEENQNIGKNLTDELATMAKALKQKGWMMPAVVHVETLFPGGMLKFSIVRKEAVKKFVEVKPEEEKSP